MSRISLSAAVAAAHASGPHVGDAVPLPGGPARRGLPGQVDPQTFRAFEPGGLAQQHHRQAGPRGRADLVAQRHAALLRHNDGADPPSRRLQPRHGRPEDRERVGLAGARREPVGHDQHDIPSDPALRPEPGARLRIEPVSQLWAAEEGCPVAGRAPHVHGLQAVPFDRADQGRDVQRVVERVGRQDPSLRSGRQALRPRGRDAGTSA